MTTNSTLKYRRAIEWCDANRRKLPKHCKVRLMSTENLYRLLDGFGVIWMTDHKLWTDKNAENGAEIVKGVSDFRASTAPSGRTLIRIVAHVTLIGKRVAEFTELCEALNWQVLKVGNPVGDNGVEFVRAYITVMCSEDGD